MVAAGAIPSPRLRVSLAILAILVGFVISAVVSGLVVEATGWEFGVPSGLGDDVGRVAGQLAAGVPLDHNRGPLVAQTLLTVPLWLCFLGVPWLYARRKLDLRRDFGWNMTHQDIVVGLFVGVATQVVVLPLIYAPLRPFIDADALEAPARNLVAAADSSIGVVALVVLTIVGAPIAEEFLYRGLLHRGLVDWLSRFGRFGVLLAVFGSSFVFAASHFQVPQFPGLLVFGIVAATALQISGRLGTALWIHVGFNATSVIVLLQQLS